MKYHGSLTVNGKFCRIDGQRIDRGTRWGDRYVKQRKQFQYHRSRIAEFLSGGRIGVWKACDVIDRNERKFL